MHRSNRNGRWSTINVEGFNIFISANKYSAETLTVNMILRLDKSKLRVTGVYGPSEGNNRDYFMHQLRNEKPIDDIPWILCGDFNLVLAAHERSSNIMHLRDRAFKRTVDELALIDMPMLGRHYTWSNAREKATLVRHDRFLISQCWNQQFPATSQKALPSVASYHCPILCTCSTKFSLPNTFQFENYWLRLIDFIALVQNSWTQSATSRNPIELNNKLIKLRQKIITWKKEKLGDVNSQEEICKSVLAWLDKQQDMRQLSYLESLMKTLLIDRYQQIAKDKQRAKRNWIKEGDKNTTYFHMVATFQKRQNMIHTLEEGQFIHRTCR
jgi:hypothetical protein